MRSGRGGQRRAVGIPCCLTLALAACDAATRPTGTIHTDSAGIRIATAVEPLGGPGEGWRVSEEPLVEIGSATGASEYLLDGVVGAVRLGSGDIVIAESTSGELRRYDRNGVFVWRTSGEGKGPGDHAFLEFLGALAGDSVVTYDTGLYRAQIFGPDGRIARTVRAEAPWPGFLTGAPVALLGRHLVIEVQDRRGDLPDGVVRWPAVRIATLSLDDGTFEAVTDVPGAEQVISASGRGISFMSYAFGKRPLFAAHAGRLAHADTKAFSIRFISLDDRSTTAILRRDEPLREVTEEHIEAYLDWMARRNMYGGRTEEDMEAMKPGWRARPMASTLPALQSIHLDAVGNLWVEPHAPHGAAVPPFEVYTPAGDWLGTVAVPPGLALGTGGISTGFEIGEDYILGEWVGELGVSHVRLYALEK